MKLFECQNCGQVLYFENTLCENCKFILGYLSDQANLSALTPNGPDTWRPLATPEETFRFCDNARHKACNWLIPAESTHGLCRACRLNRTIPNLEIPENLLLWQQLEAAKHRLAYALLRFGLPMVDRKEDPEAGLAFDFLSGSDSPFRETAPVVTGHSHGLITIDLAEADPAAREQHRQDMAEPYRTLLGHFRHETGHYYWDRLIRDGEWLEACRGVFGDERCDYGAALKDHYANAPRADWPVYFISHYASAHPWEDFAETWAHYLHIVDTLETASAFGLAVHPKAGDDPFLHMEIDFDPYVEGDFDLLVQAWVPLTSAVNNLNTSMGQPDLYPFVLSPAVIGKLRFIHGLIHSPRGKDVRAYRSLSLG